MKRPAGYVFGSDEVNNDISKPDVAEETKSDVPATTDEYIRDAVPTVKRLRETEPTNVDNCESAISELVSDHDVTLDACLSLGTPALSRLYHALSLDRNLIYRLHIVWTIRELGPDATPYLIRIFKRYPDLRVDAVTGLGSTGGSSAVEFLSKMLKEKPSVLRSVLPKGSGYAPIEYYIACSLGKIGDPAAIPALADYLRDPAGRVDTSGRRNSVIYALGAIGDPAAVPILREVINSWAPGGVNIEKARTAVEVLNSRSREIDIDSANVPKTPAVYTVDMIRNSELIEVIDALRKIGTEEARDLMRELQNDQSEEVRTLAGNILRMMASETDN